MSGDVVFIGDVHLGAGDPAVAEFVGFLESLGTTARTIVLLGDLFDLWLGDRALEQPHHRAVADKLAELRRRGLRVRYVEGNRDYRIAGGYTGTALDEATDLGIVERCGGLRYLAIHGDLTNPADWRYRSWRRFSRSRTVWWVLKRLPARARLALAERLERSMRDTNASYKTCFPENAVREYARTLLSGDADALVLGHFHVEREFVLTVDGRDRRAFVLPEWKGTRRYLRVDDHGTATLVGWPELSSSRTDPSST